MNRAHLSRLAVLAMAVACAVPLTAQDITTFTNGQVADANAVNANFATVKGAADAAQATAVAAQATADGAQAAAATAQSTANSAQASVGSLTSVLNVSGNFVGLGTSALDSNLQIANGLDNDGNVASFKIQSADTRLLMDGNEIDSFSTNPLDSNNLYLQFNASSNSRIFMVANGGRVGINTLQTTDTLTVNGSASKPGGGSWSVFSDVRLKKNITPIRSALDTLLALRGVHFEYQDAAAIHELPGERTGFIAQEVEKVLPDWVSTGDDGLKRMTVRGFEALAVEALREVNQRNLDLQAENDGLQQRLEALEAMVAQLQPLLAAKK